MPGGPFPGITYKLEPGVWFLLPSQSLPSISSLPSLVLLCLSPLAVNLRVTGVGLSFSRPLPCSPGPLLPIQPLDPKRSASSSHAPSSSH